MTGTPQAVSREARHWCAQPWLAQAERAPFLRMADTATASVDAIMAENSAPCSQAQPSFLSWNTYSSTGVKMAVLAMTMRKAKQMTWISICARDGVPHTGIRGWTQASRT